MDLLGLLYYAWTMLRLAVGITVQLPVTGVVLAYVLVRQRLCEHVPDRFGDACVKCCANLSASVQGRP